MKKVLLYKIVTHIKSKPGLLRKLKIFAVIGGVFFLIIGGLTVWMGVSAFNYVAAKATPQNLETLKAEALALPRIHVLNCWGKAQSLMVPQAWLERPLADNLAGLKKACLEQKPAVCKGHECVQIKELINTAEGVTI